MERTGVSRSVHQPDGAGLEQLDSVMLPMTRNLIRIVAQHHLSGRLLDDGTLHDQAARDIADSIHAVKSFLY